MLQELIPFDFINKWVLSGTVLAVMRGSIHCHRKAKSKSNPDIFTQEEIHK